MAGGTEGREAHKGRAFVCPAGDETCAGGMPLGDVEIEPAFDAGEMLYRTGYPPALRVNWHLGHCLAHGEDVDEAYRHVKGMVKHVHFSLPKEPSGLVHLHRQAELLLAEGYDGFFSVELIGPENPDGVMASHAEGWKDLRGKLGF